MSNINVDVEEAVMSSVLSTLTKNEVDLYDCYVSKNTIKVFLSKKSGINFQQIQSCNREITEILDSVDPQILQKYELEVSSPGIERNLRKKEHFLDSVGLTVMMKTRSDSGLPRRLQGKLLSAGDTECVLEHQGVNETIGYSDIGSAKTVFVWEDEMADDASESESKIRNRKSVAKKKAGELK